MYEDNCCVWSLWIDGIRMRVSSVEGGRQCCGTRTVRSPRSWCIRPALAQFSHTFVNFVVFHGGITTQPRTPSNLKIPAGSGGAEAGKSLTDPKLKMIAGDVTKKADVDKVFESPIDGVIIALGGKTSDVGDTMLTDGTKNVIAAMKEKGVKRVAVVTSIGAGDSESQAPFMFKVSFTKIEKLTNHFVSMPRIV
jgi:hypothetical protein